MPVHRWLLHRNKETVFGHLSQSSHSECGERLSETGSGFYPCPWMPHLPLFSKGSAWSPHASVWVPNQQNVGPQVGGIGSYTDSFVVTADSWFLKDAVSVPWYKHRELSGIHNQLHVHLGFFHYILWDTPSQPHNKWCHPGRPPGSTGISCVLNLCPNYNSITKSHYSIYKYSTHYFLWLTGV